MIVGMIDGVTRIIGKAQGYIGLPIRDEEFHSKTHDALVPSMVTCWEPTPEEIIAIVAGGRIEVRLLGSSHPPIIVGVGRPPFCESPEDRMDQQKAPTPAVTRMVHVFEAGNPDPMAGIITKVHSATCVNVMYCRDMSGWEMASSLILNDHGGSQRWWQWPQRV